MHHGKVTELRKKRKYEQGRKAAETAIGEEKKKAVRTKGAGRKMKLVSSGYANVVVDGKNVVCKILDLVKNPANKDFTRRRIITKGAVLSVKTPEGKDISVRVTSRPGQDGLINAVTV